MHPVVFHSISKTGVLSGGKIIEHKTCLLIFSTNFVRNISHSMKNADRYYLKRTQVSMLSTPYSCHIVIKLEFSQHIF